MFSVTNTGLKILPLWTVNVRPMKSGVMVERRDHVLMGVFWFDAFAFWILSSRLKSINGPFLIERPIINYLFFIGRPFLCTTMKRFEDLYFARVLPPLATKPHGDTNCCQPPPPLDLPWPPPFGWSTGFRATRRLMPLCPRRRVRPSV